MVKQLYKGKHVVDVIIKCLVIPKGFSSSIIFLTLFWTTYFKPKKLSMKEFSFIKFDLVLKVLMSTALLNLDFFENMVQEFSKSSQKYWRKNVC